MSEATVPTTTPGPVAMSPEQRVKALREFLAVHPAGVFLTGGEVDDLALGLARVAMDFEPGPGFDLVAHLMRQREFSANTFGPGQRLQGVIDHLRKELVEVEASGGELSEWVDVVLLALDGAWRSGYTPEQIADGLAAKQLKNEGRQWPDWRTAEQGKAIEHVRTAQEAG